MHTLWPIYFAVTSLPPHLRMNKEYILLGGVWFGPKKPNMSIILEPVLKELNHLYCTGVEAKISGITKVIRAKLLLSVFDLPAKAAVVNLKQFNGRYGCLYCTNPGKNVTPGCSVYLPSAQQHATERTNSLMIAWASDAEISGESVYGVKGHSILSSAIDIVNGVPIDYMHAVLEGVTKYFTSMWLNSKYHQCSFYLGRKTKEIDKILLQLKPPGQFHRSPREISHIKLWKASELRAWLLFYSLPILQHYWPSEYVHHWSLLVFSIHLLLSSRITISDIEVVDSALKTFYLRVPEMYGDSACTANVHSLIHVTQMVKLWGPLWTHSLFGFENMNGHIRKLFHGTRQILDQLVFYVTAHRSLCFQTRLLCAEHERCYFSQFDYDSSVSGYSFEGKSHKVSLPLELHAIVECFVTHKVINTHTLSSKFRKGCTLYSCKYFSQEKSRNSSVCFFEANGEIKIGCIKLFHIDFKLALITPFNVIGRFLSSLRPSRNETVAEECGKLRSMGIFFVVEDTNTQLAIPLHTILESCILLEINNEKIVVKSPNEFEFH